MRVKAITDTEQLRALEQPWNALASDMPLRSWDWIATWWKHYGNTGHDGLRKPPKCLFVLAAYDSDEATSQPVAIAPFYLCRSLTKGNVLRLLGTGEVCTDHLSILCDPDDAQAVAGSLAVFLTTEVDDWDAIELKAIDVNDDMMAEFVNAMMQRACEATKSRADSCWQIALPTTWDEYLSRQSKSHRKQLRRAERRLLDSSRTQWHRVEDQRDFEQGWSVLVELHQRRRRSLGEPGCFASQPFYDFHWEVAQRLLNRGWLRLSWLELDRAAIAAEYHIAGQNATFAYQGGLDPQRLGEEPGRLSTLLCIRAAIEEGHDTFDFLRGDEPYKAHWRAEPQQTVDYRIIPSRPLARLRGRVVQLADIASTWVKTEVKETGLPTFNGGQL